eukprot:1158580-Pelagomonas_calceolata.AAC.18
MCPSLSLHGANERETFFIRGRICTLTCMPETGFSESGRGHCQLWSEALEHGWNQLFNDHLCKYGHCRSCTKFFSSTHPYVMSSGVEDACGTTFSISSTACASTRVTSVAAQACIAFMHACSHCDCGGVSMRAHLKSTVAPPCDFELTTASHTAIVGLASEAPALSGLREPVYTVRGGVQVCAARVVAACMHRERTKSDGDAWAHKAAPMHPSHGTAPTHPCVQVPRSSRIVAEDNDYTLVTVVLFKRVVDEFKASARSKGYQATVPSSYIQRELTPTLHPAWTKGICKEGVQTVCTVQQQQQLNGSSAFEHSPTT